MCFWLRQPLRDSYQTLANSELKIASVAFGKCREEYHYFFAPTSAGRSLRFCKKKRITRAKPAYRRQDAKAQRRDGRQALREEKKNARRGGQARRCLFSCSDFKAVEVNSLFWTSSRELSYLFSECRRQHGG